MNSPAAPPLKFKAVVLDYGEVLCHRPTPEEFSRMSEFFAVTPEHFNDLWHRDRLAFDRGDLEPEQYWSKLADYAGKEITSDDVKTVQQWDLEMWARANHDMVDWMRALKNAGIKVALLSNIHPTMVEYVRGLFDWIEEFDFQTFSADVRMVKPFPEIYEHTLKGLGVRPEETVFLDDRERNIEGARKLGIVAIRFSTIPRLIQDLEAIHFPVLPKVSVPVVRTAPDAASTPN